MMLIRVNSWVYVMVYNLSIAGSQSYMNRNLIRNRNVCARVVDVKVCYKVACEMYKTNTTDCVGQ